MHQFDLISNMSYNITRKVALSALGLSLAQVLFSQNDANAGSITGNVQAIAQYYNGDSLINAAEPDHKMGMNSFANINFYKGDFSAGVRFESYLNRLEGYPDAFNGTGIGYRYASWKNEGVEVTVGNFYDQFGSGMILRIYEERQLGIDNSLDGIKVKYSPYKGIALKGLVGKQRLKFESGLINGNGMVRGFDGEVNLNELLDSTVLGESKLKLTIGGSFVSKFNEDNNTADFIMPKNVGAYGGRLSARYGKFRFFGEYILKENDPYPSQDPNFNYLYKNGEGLLLNLGYSTKGFAIDLNAKHQDNMLWRSTNTTTLPTDLLIGYLPALSKQHTYALAGTLYPYAPNQFGEIAYQADILYKVKKKTLIGGKYGMDIALNFATARAPHRTYLYDDSTDRHGYETSLFKSTDNGIFKRIAKLGSTSLKEVLTPTDSSFFRDINISISKKINKKLKLKVQYLNFVFDDRVVLVAKEHELIFADLAIADLTWKVNKKNTLRFETQGLWTEEDQGNWAFGLIEYTYSPHWFVAVLDQWNYGNHVESQQIHYILGTAGYINGSNRFTIQYGKQRAGVFCVGGVCRQVPASNGLTFSFTSSF
ncbi:MAG: hypothetical protein ACI8Q1_000504 [Parvicella sp.]